MSMMVVDDPYRIGFPGLMICASTIPPRISAVGAYQRTGQRSRSGSSAKTHGQDINRQSVSCAEDDDAGLVLVDLERRVRAGAHCHNRSFSQLIVTALNDRSHIDESLRILHAFEVVSEILGQVIEHNFCFVQRSYLLINIAGSYRDGEYVDFRNRVDKSRYVTQVFFGRFSQFTGIRIKDEYACTKILVRNFLSADNSVVFGSLPQRVNSGGHFSIASLTRFLGNFTLSFS